MILRSIEYLSVLVLLLAAGCTPIENGSEAISIARLKSLYRGVPLELTGDMGFEAVVVSSDKYRNFADMIYVEDPTGGVALLIEGDRLYRAYPTGGIVAVSCTGLWLGSYGGEIRLGARPAGERECTPMNATTAALNIVRTDRTVEPQPKEVAIGDLTQSLVGCYVGLGDVRFTEQSVGWYDAVSLGRRYVVDGSADTLEVYTRAESLFGGLPLPQGRGTIRGIVTCFAGRYSLRVNNEFDNDFE